MPDAAARARASSTQASTVAPPSITSAPSARQPSTFPSGAPGGITTSHGIPRWRAASATAHAWFPALPATTPWSARAPSASSFAAAPRTLNEPVRCRHSALRTTSPPERSLSVHESSTGVRRATAATAGRARAMSCAVTVRAAATGQSGSATIASISTSVPSGSSATPIVVRAGGCPGKYSA